VSIRSKISNAAADQGRHPVPGQLSHWFATANHSVNAARKIASTVYENGGQAITISTNPTHAARFRKGNHQPCVKYGEMTTASRSKSAPAYSESPDAK